MSPRTGPRMTPLALETDRKGSVHLHHENMWGTERKPRQRWVFSGSTLILNQPSGFNYLTRYESVCTSGLFTAFHLICWRNDAFKLLCWRRLLRVPWTVRRSNQSILKEINPEYSLEGLMLKLKLQYFGHLTWRTDSLERTLMQGKIEGRRIRGWQRIRWQHHQLNGHESEQTLGDNKGQRSLACCSPWGHKESDVT